MQKKKKSRVKKMKRWLPKLDEHGREVLDPTPLEVPLDHVPELTLHQQVARLEALQHHMLMRRRRDAGLPDPDDDPASYFDEDSEYDDPDPYDGVPHQEEGYSIARDIEHGKLDSPYVEKQGRKARRNPLDIIKEKQNTPPKAKDEPPSDPPV